MAKQVFLQFEYADALNPKTRELCALAASAAAQCSHWTRRHFAGAKKEGASVAEIRQVLAMAMMVNAGRIRSFVMDNLEGIGLKLEED